MQILAAASDFTAQCVKRDQNPVRDMGRTTPRISHETGLVQVVYVLLTQFGRAVLGNGYSGFGEGSPERKAATNLQHFFNYVAVRVVLAQLEVAFFFPLSLLTTAPFSSTQLTLI